MQYLPKSKKWLDAHNIAYTDHHIKDQNPTVEEQYALLAFDGMLVKRPLLITNNTLLISFKETEWENLSTLKSNQYQIHHKKA